MSASGVSFCSREGSQIPLMVQSKKPVALVEWISEHRAMCDTMLKQHKALLFRGFDVSEASFPDVVRTLCKQPLEYIYRSTPRTNVAPNVYTATEYPAHQFIPQHNEEAYQLDWPMRLIFFCSQPAAEGGETPIADTVKVTQRIDPGIVEKFAQKKVMYVRNYGSGIDLSWQVVFQTEDTAKVEAFCNLSQIAFEWKQGGHLQTKQICQGVAKHPVTGQTLWFNQAHLFHISSLDLKTQQALLSIYREDELPRNAYYGDGSPLEPDVLDHIRQAYEAESVAFRWKTNDVVLLDNMLVSHGRRPFKGKRRVLVAMGDAYSCERSLAAAQVLSA